MTRARGKKPRPVPTVKFREKDAVRITAEYAGEPEIIGATGVVTRGSFGRKNGYIYLELDDKTAAEKYLHGDPVVIVLPIEIEHLPRSTK